MNKKTELLLNERLRPGAVIRGATLSEPIRVIATVRQGEAIRIAGVGTESGKVQECEVKAAQIDRLEVIAEPVPEARTAPPAAPLFVYYYLSQLLKCPVRLEGESRPFGSLYDVGARQTPFYAQTTFLEVRGRKRKTSYVPWSAVVEFSAREIVVRGEPVSAAEADFWLRRDVLDDQVVDLSGAKARRVNDVHMLYAEEQLVAAHVEVGVLGILRRLGFEKPVGGALHWLFDYTLKDSFVSWRNVEVLSPGGSPGGLKVSATPSRFAGIHPAELADIIEQLGVKERHTVFGTLPVELAADTLEEARPRVQRSLISQAEPGKAANILQEMPPLEAAGVLRDLRGVEAETIIHRMEQEAAEDVTAILAHAKKTAGGIMTVSCVTAGPRETAAAVIEHIGAVAGDVEVLNHVYVLDDDRRLLGVLSLRELLSAAPDATLESLMTRQLIKVLPETGLHDVARLFVKYGFRAIPVVNKENTFLGAVRLRSVLSELSPLFRE